MYLLPKSRPSEPPWASLSRTLDRTWREIGVMIGQPGMRPVPLEGDLEKVPALDAVALEKVYAANPELQATLKFRAGAEMLAERARVEKFPDVVVRGGVRHNNELVGAGFPAGPEGFFDVAVQIPIFNRNQGALAAARAEAEKSRLETDRQRLLLARRFAAVFREYQDAVAASARYRDQMIPAAMQAYEMYLSNFGNMTAAYAQVLLTQRNLIQLREEYVAALVSAWRSAVEIEGLLVTD
jgi:cobalt-zinc-cadmium efflux system outer membrane protein